MIAVFLFYNISGGVQSGLAFSHEFKHCNIITYDGEYWINIEMDSTGILTRVLDVPNGNALIRGLKTVKPLTAMVVTFVEKRHRVRWKPWWVRSCNEVDRYISGVNVGFTFNPYHLYQKLIRYNSKNNYEILYAWRRSNGILRRR